jgi:hypothetical protein
VSGLRLFDCAPGTNGTFWRARTGKAKKRQSDFSPRCHPEPFRSRCYSYGQVRPAAAESMRTGNFVPLRLEAKNYGRRRTDDRRRTKDKGSKVFAFYRPSSYRSDLPSSERSGLPSSLGHPSPIINHISSIETWFLWLFIHIIH